MPSQKTTKAQTAGGRADNTEGRGNAPQVIVEILFENGVFFICVNNIGSQPALKISVKFDKKLIGLGGTKEISGLALFKNIEFLGPGRNVTTLLDTSTSYFKRRQPTAVSVRIVYFDSDDKKYESLIKHDLEIYRDLSYLPTTLGKAQNDDRS